GDNVAVGTHAAIRRPPDLDNYPWRILVGILDLYWLTGLQIFDVGEPGARISNSCKSRRGFARLRHHPSGYRSNRCGRASLEELATTQFDGPIAALHRSLPIFRSLDKDISIIH